MALQPYGQQSLMYPSMYGGSFSSFLGKVERVAKRAVNTGKKINSELKKAGIARHAKQFLENTGAAQKLRENPLGNTTLDYIDKAAEAGYGRKRRKKGGRKGKGRKKKGGSRRKVSRGPRLIIV